MFDSENTILSVFIPIINDEEADGTESFTVQLTTLPQTQNATVCSNTTVSINDDEAAPTTPGILMVNISPFLHVLLQLLVLFAYSSQSDDTVAAEQV